MPQCNCKAKKNVDISVRSNSNDRYTGFTLIELMIALTIIGILASFVMVSTRKAIDRAKIAKTLAWDSSLYSSLGADCVGDWEFDMGDGTTARDFSGNGNDGIIHGASPTDDTPNHSLGKALSFNGSSDYVDCGNGSSLDITDAITIEAWVKPNTGYKSDYRNIVSKDTTGNTWNLLTNKDTGVIRFWVAGNVLNGITALPENKWTHVVATYDAKEEANNQKVYFNTDLDNQGTVTGNISVSDAVVAIGKYVGGSYPFSGLIDQVRIYNEALDSAEIKEHYLAGLKRHQNLAMR